MSEQYAGHINRLGFLARKIAQEHGFDSGWESGPEKIALMHSELSEALEGMRCGNPLSKKIPEFSSVEEELADTIIRIAEFSEACSLRLGEAIEAKMEYNRSRPYKHGKSF